MKVYLVYCFYDNGEHYEDNITSDIVLAVTFTRGDAEKYISSIDVNKDEDKERPWIEGNPYSNYPDAENVVKHFYRQPRYQDFSDYEEEVYRIEEMEVYHA